MYSKYRYISRSKQEWIDDFIRQYEVLKPRSSKEYNTRRNADSPRWETVARYCGFKTWRELIVHTQVNPRCLRLRDKFRTEELQVGEIYKPLEEMYDRTIEENNRGMIRIFGYEYCRDVLKIV